MGKIVFNNISRTDNEASYSTTHNTSSDKQPNKMRKKLQRNLVHMWKKEQKGDNYKYKMNSFIGDNTDQKEPSTLRILSNNINGLSDINELAQYIIGSLQLESDIACFQEINVDTRQQEIARQLRKVVAQVDDSKGDAIHMTSSTRILDDGYKKRGGTMIRICKKFAGSSFEKYEDIHGRWSSISIEGGGGRKLYVYSVY